MAEGPCKRKKRAPRGVEVGGPARGAASRGINGVMDRIAWLDTLYEVLDTDYDEPPERTPEEEVREKTSGMGDLDRLAWVLVEEMGPDGIEALAPLVDRPGGERLFHAALARVTAPPYLSHGSFEQAGVTAPTEPADARFLTKMRDYAIKGETDRVWFFAQEKLWSMSEKGKVAREVDDAGTFVKALGAALL